MFCLCCLLICHQKVHNMERLGTNVSLDAMEMQCQSWSDRRLTCGTSYWYVVLLVWSSYRISPQQASFPVTAVDAIDEETEQKVTPRSSHMAAASKWYTISEPFSYQSFEEPMHSWESTPKDSGVCAGMPYHASPSSHMIWYCTLESSRARFVGKLFNRETCSTLAVLPNLSKLQKNPMVSWNALWNPPFPSHV